RRHTRSYGDWSSDVCSSDLTIAGGIPFIGDGGKAVDASLNLNPVANGVAIDGAGNLFVSDGNNQRIRRVDAMTGIITTIAGNGEIGRASCRERGEGWVGVRS